MSQNTPDTHVITSVPETETEKTETVEKQSFVAKTKNFVKNNKRPAIAVGALVALVGVSALAGRKTAPSYDFEPIALDFPEDDVIDVEVIEVPETTSA